MDISLVKTQLGDLSAFFSGVHGLIVHVPTLLRGLVLILSNGKYGV
ncbi:MAG: hypothetical protein Q3972_00300 [Corynebacterium sp.]|nr:hypothetical protein [Corynebacterium sp.]